ncbi:MAG: helix-turn-helix transcriptional regulator [Oscillospiraceae bacterium]|nr:helix-turn-helix transcriptional regulator [Oscillospiraceae bacterium]
MYERYARLRDERGVTDYRVAKETGIGTASLANWKAGRYAPKVEKLKKIADFFGVSLDYFVGE